MNETFTNSKGVTKPVVTVEVRRGNPKPFRVMVRGVEVSAWSLKGLAQEAARRAEASA